MGVLWLAQAVTFKDWFGKTICEQCCPSLAANDHRQRKLESFLELLVAAGAPPVTFPWIRHDWALIWGCGLWHCLNRSRSSRNRFFPAPPQPAWKLNKAGTVRLGRAMPCLPKDRKPYSFFGLMWLETQDFPRSVGPPASVRAFSFARRRRCCSSRNANSSAQLN